MEEGGGGFEVCGEVCEKKKWSWVVEILSGNIKRHYRPLSPVDTEGWRHKIWHWELQGPTFFLSQSPLLHLRANVSVRMARCWLVLFAKFRRVDSTARIPSCLAPFQGRCSSFFTWTRGSAGCAHMNECMCVCVHLLHHPHPPPTQAQGSRGILTSLWRTVKKLRRSSAEFFSPSKSLTQLILHNFILEQPNMEVQKLDFWLLHNQTLSFGKKVQENSNSREY